MSLQDETGVSRMEELEWCLGSFVEGLWSIPKRNPGDQGCSRLLEGPADAMTLQGKKVLVAFEELK